MRFFAAALVSVDPLVCAGVSKRCLAKKRLVEGITGALAVSPQVSQSAGQGNPVGFFSCLLYNLLALGMLLLL